MISAALGVAVYRFKVVDNHIRDDLVCSKLLKSRWHSFSASNTARLALSRDYVELEDICIHALTAEPSRIVVSSRLGTSSKISNQNINATFAH